jgi:predicted HicB family RNase H-like nuclease
LTKTDFLFESGFLMSVTEAPKVRKRRTSIYGERITVSLRLDPVLHALLMAHVQKTQQVANVFISDALEVALKKAGR